MKFGTILITISLLSLSTLANTSFASPSGRLLFKKTIESSLTTERAPKQICDIYESEIKLTVTHGFNPQNIPVFTSTSTMAVETDSSFSEVVSKALTAPIIETASNLCISPRVKIVGYQENGQEFLLYASDGCKQPHQTRRSLESDALRSFVLQYCPGL
ncbi:MAG: hypothetical protein NT027_19420 [Proteobacteria bacterium]|nr:hypothetical protein [Pseudomonadota bacterium]